MPHPPEPVNLTVVRNDQAYAELRRLLDQAIRDLRALDIEPVVVASCPLKFNDVRNDEDWYGIQIGHFVNEKSDYFETLNDFAEGLKDGPENTRIALRVLKSLEGNDWRGVYERAFERSMSPEEVIAIVLQEGKALLVVSASNSGEDAVYEILHDNDLVHVGRGIADTRRRRFDQRLGEATPLVLRSLAEDAARRGVVDARIGELEQAPSLGPQRWWQHRRPRGGTLLARLCALAEAGKVTQADFYALQAALYDCGERMQ